MSEHGTKDSDKITRRPGGNNQKKRGLFSIMVPICRSCRDRAVRPKTVWVANADVLDDYCGFCRRMIPRSIDFGHVLLTLEYLHHEWKGAVMRPVDP